MDDARHPRGGSPVSKFHHGGAAGGAPGGGPAASHVGMTSFAEHALFSTILLTALSPLTACSNGGTEPDGTDSTHAGGDPPATFADVQAIFDMHCTGCHNASAQGLQAYPALSLVAGDAYAGLVGKPADEACGGIRVVAGSPETSYLMSKIGPGMPCDGEHMPKPFEVGPRFDLAAADLATVRSWIGGGAQP